MTTNGQAVSVAVKLIEHTLVESIREGGQPHPMVTAVRDGKLVGTMVIGAFHTAEEKEDRWKQVVLFLKALDAEAASHGGDTWVVRRDVPEDQREAAKRGEFSEELLSPPEEDPNRLEAISISSVNREGEAIMREIMYHREDDGSIRFEMPNETRETLGDIAAALKEGVRGAYLQQEERVRLLEFLESEGNTILTFGEGQVVG
jgi:hypothetical protein